MADTDCKNIKKTKEKVKVKDSNSVEEAPVKAVKKEVIMADKDRVDNKKTAKTEVKAKTGDSNKGETQAKPVIGFRNTITGPSNCTGGTQADANGSCQEVLP